MILTSLQGQLEPRTMLLTQAPGQRVPKLWYCRLESDHVCIAKRDHHDYFEKAMHWPICGFKYHSPGSKGTRTARFQVCKDGHGGSVHVKFLLATFKSLWDIIYGENTSKPSENNTSLTWNRSRCSSSTPDTRHTLFLSVTHGWRTSSGTGTLCGYVHAS